MLQALISAGFVPKETTKRTMLMSFSMIGRIAEDQDGPLPAEETDIRCRVTNGQAEVVVKLGGVHAHDRREVTTPINIDELPHFARVLGSLNMLHKVGSRMTQIFTKNDIIASLVSSRSGITYLELEKISDETHAEQDQKELTDLAETLNLKLIKDREAFIELCTRLTNQDDWRFYGSENDIQRFLQEAEDMRSLKQIC